MGPTTLFDKSFLQSLNVDEAALFDSLYRSVLCPVFYIETLADLETEIRRGRTPEQIVGEIANKTPVMHSTPNVIHSSLCLNDFLGEAVEMRSVPVLGGGRPVRRDGKVAIVYREAPEMTAFQRWQRGRFLEVERDMAKAWRNGLASLDLSSTTRLLKDAGAAVIRPGNLEEVKALASHIVNSSNQRYRVLETAYEVLNLPREFWPFVVRRWKASGGAPLSIFAPYAAHCYKVDVFFYLAMWADLISPDRPSNKIDMAYLYYLPFAMIFVSSDRLHQRVAPHFMRKNQTFIFGPDLKSDLRALDEHYSVLPQDELERGLMHFAGEPPRDSNFLTTRLWRQCFPKWSLSGEEMQCDKMPDGAQRRIIREGLELAKQRGSGERFTRAELNDPNRIMIERLWPARRGKWRLLPQEIVDKGSRSA